MDTHSVPALTPPNLSCSAAWTHQSVLLFSSCTLCCHRVQSLDLNQRQNVCPKTQPCFLWLPLVHPGRRQDRNYNPTAWFLWCRGAGLCSNHLYNTWGAGTFARVPMKKRGPGEQLVWLAGCCEETSERFVLKDSLRIGVLMSLT